MSWARELLQELRRPLLAVGCIFTAFVLAVMLLSAAVGIWPPFMAVESKSMQHSDTASRIGIIDTGDVVVVSRPPDQEGIRTYAGSVAHDYKSFGQYGDVVIYQAPDEPVPIVHRAICELVYNASSAGFDIPDLSTMPKDLWSVPGPEQRWWGLNQSVDLLQVGHSEVRVHIDLASMLDVMGEDAHGGLITMGDNNWFDHGDGKQGVIDQGSIVDVPLPWEWVLGKVTGEVPWIGTLRLWLTGTAPSYLPHNTIAMLALSIGAIVALPIGLWSAAAITERWGRRSRRSRK